MGRQRGGILSKFIALLLPPLLLFHSAIAGAQQPDRSPSLNLGDAVVTGFSGTAAPDPNGRRPANKSATDLTFIDANGPSVRVIDVGRPGYVWDGRLFSAVKKFDVFAKDVGQVFGVALDDQPAPNIYVAATSVFGLHIVSRGRDGTPERRKKGGPGAGWMTGQFGLDLQGGPGGIFKIDGRTGVTTLFANVALDGVPNPGPGLGNLAYDPAHKQLFVSDLYTGMIHRFDLDGKDLGVYDHGVTGLGAAKLAVAPFNPRNRPNIASDRFDAEKPDTWGFAPAARRVWGLAVHEGRLYYSVVSGPQIWSVGIERDGGFAGDPRWELDVPAQSGPLPVSDIAFSQKGAMILAQRALIAGAYDYSAFTRPGEPQVFRVWLNGPNDPPSPGRWKLVPEEYAIGFAGNYRNTNGGVALGYGYGQDGTLSADACEFSLWSTAQNIRNAPPLKSRLDPGGPLVVHGIAGVPASPVRNFNEPPWTSYAVDYDDVFDDPRATGHLGSVRIYSKPCVPPAVYSGPGYPANPPYVSGPATTTTTTTVVPPPPPPPPTPCLNCPPPPCVNCPPALPPFDLGVGKIGEFNPANPYGPYNFTLGVRNLGPAISGPQTITVTDVVPPGMTFTNVTSSNWTCAPLPGPPIPAGGTLTCTYTGSFPIASNQALGWVTIVATGGAGPFKNCATLGQPDSDPSNDQACVTVDSKVGELIVKKVVVAHVHGTQLPSQNYTVNVTCGGTTTPLTLTDGGSQTVSNIPYNTSCSVVELPPTVPPNMCPSGTSGVWSIAYAPPQPLPPIVINAPTTTVTVTNTFDCIKDRPLGSIDLEKVVATPGIPSQTYPVTVNCGGTITTLNLVDGVTQTVSNIPLGTGCTVLEAPPALPPNICPPGSTPVWSTSYIYTPPGPVIITSTPVSVMVRNTLACSPVGGPTSSLRVLKVIINNTAASLAGMTFPATATCGGNATALNLSTNGPQFVNNLAVGALCSVVETTPLPAPPTTGCAKAGDVPTWVTPPTYVPVSIPITSGFVVPTITVTNTLDCKPAGSGGNGSLIVNKTVINNTNGQVSTAGLSYPATATCGGVPTSLTLTESTPGTVNNLALGTNCSVQEGPLPTVTCPTDYLPSWSTVYIPTTPVPVNGPNPSTITVQNTLVCKIIGAVRVAKQVINNTTADVSGLTFPMTVSCVAGSSPAATFPVTVSGGSSQTVHNIASGSVCTVNETLPPPPTTGCDGGKVPTWVTPPAYSPPSVIAANGAGPIITVTNTLNCEAPGSAHFAPSTCDPRTTIRKGGVCTCRFENMMRVSAGTCGCAAGTSFVASKGCVRPPECKPPMVPGAVPGVCVCPPGTVKKGSECVRPTVAVCNAPAKLNRKGACECPTDMVAVGKGCVARERRQLDVSPGLRNIPGGFGPGGGGRQGPSGGGREGPAGAGGGSPGISPGRR